LNYLTLENLTKSYGEKILFTDVNLQISKGHKVALVAKNGTGKTTLLRVISGQEGGEGENCKVFIHKDIRIGYLPQEPELDDTLSIMESVFNSDNELIQAIREYEEAMLNPDDQESIQAAVTRMEDLKAWDFESKIKEVLFKLNITDLKRRVGTLSGGQRKRLALAKILIDEPDFLILDEPTNHLDLDMVEWLEEYLQQPNLTLFLVTHDRYFLERVCDYIIELDQGKIYKYTGNYSDFLEKKTTRHEQDSVELEKARKLMKRELEWIRRMPKARGTKAKSRVDAFDTIVEKASRKVDAQAIQIDIKGERLGSKILECHNVHKAFGDTKIVEGFHYKFKRNERVGIVGKNGVGKTTFLKLLTKEIRPDAGKVVVGGTVKFGYYTQEGMQLKEDKRVIDVITDIAEYIPMQKGQKLTAPQLLERFLFSRKQQQVYVSQLSGGERRRLHLLAVLMENPNFLILDEPTNDLDLITLNVLEEFLLDFPGCVIVVSHDRYFMDKLVDHLFVFEGDGKIRDFNGNHLDYRAHMIELERAEKRQEREVKQAAMAAREASRKEEDKPTLSYEERKEMKRLEKQVAKLEDRKSEIHEEFSSGELSPEKIEELSKELASIKESIEEKELLWMELAERA
jgi:ATP-binding cassette subfamily F protein uup